MAQEKKAITISIFDQTYLIGPDESQAEIWPHNEQVVTFLKKRKLRKAEAKIEEIAHLFPNNLVAQLNLLDLKLRKKKITSDYELHLNEFFPKKTYTFSEIIAYLKVLFYWKKTIDEKKEVYTLLVRLNPEEKLLSIMEKQLFKKKPFSFLRFGWLRFRR